MPSRMINGLNYHPPRTATYVVAASDAPAHVKAQADYVCDGTADDVEIQAAIDAIVQGGHILLSQGIFNLSATIVVNKSDLMFAGVGRASFLRCGFAAGNVISAGGDIPNDINRISFRDFSIDSTVAKTSGAGIICEHANKFSFHGLHMEDGHMYDGIYLKYFDNVSISRCLLKYSHYGLIAHGKADQTWGANLWIHGGSRLLGGNHTTTWGLYLGGACGGVSVEDVDIINNRYGVWLDTALAGVLNRELFLNQCFVDASGHHGIQIANNGIGLLHLNNTWVCSSGRVVTGGVATGNNINATSIQDPIFSVVMDGCRLFNANGSGIVINAGKWIINGCMVHDNGQGADGGDGICVFNANASDLVISGNNIYNNGDAVIGTGLRVVAGVNHYIITSNITRNNGLANLTDDGGPNKVVANNLIV